MRMAVTSNAGSVTNATKTENAPNPHSGHGVRSTAAAAYTAEVTLIARINTAISYLLAALRAATGAIAIRRCAIQLPGSVLSRTIEPSICSVDEPSRGAPTSRARRSMRQTVR